jgi:mannan polymerase II complex MNN10 subunit
MSMTTAETSYDWMTISNKYEYASQHNYDLLWSFSAPTATSNYAKHWDKLDMIRDAVQTTLSGKAEYEWVWMLDYDTLITNPSIRIEDVIEKSLSFAESQGKTRDNIQMVLTRDCEPFNAGSMLFRVSPWLLGFLEEWKGGLQPETPNRTEQDVLRDMLLDNGFEVEEKSVVVRQTWFNAYPEELGRCRDERDPGDWEKGMFLIHFPGAKWFLEEEDAVGRLVRKYYWKAFPDRGLS